MDASFASGQSFWNRSTRSELLMNGRPMAIRSAWPSDNAFPAGAPCVATRRGNDKTYWSDGQVRRVTWGTYMRLSTVEVAAKAVDYHCPVEATLDVIGGKWKVVILYHLTHDGNHRFAVLRRKIPGVRERMLTQQFRVFEDDGIVHREVYAEVPPKVEYSLTDYGKTCARSPRSCASGASGIWGASLLKRGPHRRAVDDARIIRTIQGTAKETT